MKVTVTVEINDDTLRAVNEALWRTQRVPVEPDFVRLSIERIVGVHLGALDAALAVLPKLEPIITSTVEATEVTDG